MPNLYGVASPNPTPQAAQTIGGIDVTCNAGVETNFVSFQTNYPTVPGVYYPVLWGWVNIAWGATVPTSFTLAMRINNGADLASEGIDTLLMIANERLCLPIGFQQAYIIYNYPFSGITLQMSGTSVGQSTIIRNLTTVIYGQFVRAPDQ